MRAIEIRTIDHEHQREGKVGDWLQSYGMPTRIIVSRLPHPDYEFVLMMKEMLNMYASTQRGLLSKEPVDCDGAALLEDFLLDLLRISRTDYTTAIGDICKST